MLIKSIELIELDLPFKSEFSHARKTRASTGTILVRLTAEHGIEGWGEILPRSYVTGESVEAIFDEQQHLSVAKQLAQRLIDSYLPDQHALTAWIDDNMSRYKSHTALFGGVELALWNTLHQIVPVDLDTLFGRVNDRPLGHCHTIGFEHDTNSMRKQAIAARMTGATVVKLKVGVSDDIQRLQMLDKHLNGKLPIRVDANGLYSIDQTQALLEACARSTALQSFEQPFNRNNSRAPDAQKTLFSRFGVPFVADESVCSLQDAKELDKQGGFQIFNLRIGKHGGLWASKRLQDFAANHQIGLVCGSMVGETGILSQASELLLARSMQFDYVEGLGQNNRFLQVDPVYRVDASASMSPFLFKEKDCARLIKRRQMFN